MLKLSLKLASFEALGLQAFQDLLWAGIMNGWLKAIPDQ